MLAVRPERTFERLYRRHAADVYRYSLSILRDPSDAEDVTQTTFLNALRALRRGEQPRDGRHWLLAIAHNACRQHFRDAARRPRKVELQEQLAAAPAGLDEAPAHTRELLDALQALTLNQRAALVMRELEGRSYAEIADLLGVSTGAVETLLFRARRALREQLDGGLTCGAAELLLSKEADGVLSRAERPELRAHLRACAECAALARRERARRAALGSIVLLPLPPSLAEPSPWLAVALGQPLAAGGAGTGAKAAAAVAAAALVVGIGANVSPGPGVPGVQQGSLGSARPAAAAPAHAPPAVDPRDTRFSAVALLTHGLAAAESQARRAAPTAVAPVERPRSEPRATRTRRAPTAPAPAPAHASRPAPSPAPAPATVPAPGSAPAAAEPEPVREQEPRGRARRPLDGLVPVPAPPPETPPGHHVKAQNESRRG